MAVDQRDRFTISEDEMRDSMFDLDNLGICVSCGERQGGCEPDAREYVCESCGSQTVFGLEQALIEGLVDIGDES